MTEKGSSSGERVKYYKKRRVDPQSLRRYAREDSVLLRKEKRSEQFLQKRVDTEEYASTQTKSTTPAEASTTSNEAILQSVISEALSENRLDARIAIKRLIMVLCSEIADVDTRDQIIKAGVVQRLVEFLGRLDDKDLHCEATILLAYIAAGMSEHARVVVECQAVPRLIQLLSSTVRTQQYALMALGNIAADCEDFQLCIIRAQIVPPLLKLLHTSKELPVLKNGLFCLSQLHQHVPQDRPAIYSILFDLLMSHMDDEIVLHICASLRFFLISETRGVQLIKMPQVVKRIIDLLHHEFDAVQEYALCIVERLLSDDVNIPLFVNSSLLLHLQHLLNQSDFLDKEICSVLSCITTRHQGFIYAAMCAGTFPFLVKILHTGTFGAKLEAVYSIQNATAAGSPEQTEYIVQLGCIEPLCNLLSSPDNDMLHLVFCTLSNILSAGAELARDGPNVFAQEVEARNGLEKIERFQYHENETLSSIATEIINLYFGLE